MADNMTLAEALDTVLSIARDTKLVNETMGVVSYGDTSEWIEDYDTAIGIVQRLHDAVETGTI